MLITRVELENIKNYEEGSYEFGPGVTAISGPNGAGKTTILEAIAYALFDQLPYKKEDFLRRGAKKGSVRVTFKSVIDDREYTVYRDTASSYYVYDPITQFRLVEQKSQVGTWIKQNLGVDSGTDLKTLFTSTIGVPQGTFTVDFAEQPAKRKVGFDRVLRVDEYQRSAEELRALIRLVESRDIELREEIARAEVEVAQLDGLLAERSRFVAMVEVQGRDLEIAQHDREQMRLKLERLELLERSIERMTGEARGLSALIADLERRRRAISDEVERARRARDVVGATAEGFNTFNEANAMLADLDLQAARRDGLRTEYSEREREMIRVEGGLQAQREKLGQIDEDRKELERLGPLVEKQETLEERKSHLQTSLGELAGLRERAEAAGRELKSLRGEYADLSRQIDEAERLREDAERVPQLENDRRLLEAEVSEMRVVIERVSERRKDLKRVRDVIARINGEIKTLDRELEAGSAAEQIVEAIPALEAEDQAAMEEIATLRASVERDKKILAQIRGGLCPLLSERCLNMREGQTLDQFFKLQMGTERERLGLFESKRKDIHYKLADARAALKTASAAASQRVHLARFKQDLEIERATASRLEGEISGAGVSDENLRLTSARLERLNKELENAREARLKYESLNLLRSRLEHLKVEGTEKKQALETLISRVEAMTGLGDELAGVERELVSLDDPRGKARALKSGLEKEEGIKEALTRLEEQQRLLTTAMADLTRSLDEFEGLDRRLTIERERRAASERDYRAYIENQPASTILESRQDELAVVESEFQKSSAEFNSLSLALEQARSAYDEKEHTETKARLDELINLTAKLTSELNTAKAKVSELSEEIEGLVIAKQRMAQLVGQRERCKELFFISDFIRDVLKKAAPFITEAHLQSISIEANQLYREITGNPMVSLRWDPGYEIMLEEEGHERPFASLSGGEQMSAALAVRLALLKELSDLRIAFFDEPTTNMDEDRRRNLAQQIGRIRDFDQLFVISHDDAFEGFTDRVVNVLGPNEGAS